jgi:hypothetical protein
MLMYVNSSLSLDVPAGTGNFIRVIYTFNRMEYFIQFKLPSPQLLEQQHSHILGNIQLIKYQLFNIISANYHAHIIILVKLFGYTAMYSI